MTRPATVLITRYAVQTISRAVIRQNPGVDTNDLPWENVPGHGDYALLSDAWDAAEEFDGVFDDRYAHRVVEVQVEAQPEPLPAPVPGPAKAPTPRRQLAEHRGQSGFSRNFLLLEDGLRLEYARVHLDSLVELCELYLGQSGSSVLTARWRRNLDEIKSQVERRGNLRVVK